MEEAVVNLSELRHRGVWHFQPYSRKATSVAEQLSRSPFPIRPLNTLLSEQAIRGYLTVGSDIQEGVPLLSAKNVSVNGISFEGVRYLTAQEHEKLSSTQVRRGDVVVNLVARPGISAVYEYDEPANLGPHLARLRLADNIDAMYLVYYLNSDIGQSLIHSVMTGSVQPVITMEALMRLPVILPPLVEQMKIALQSRKLIQEANQLAEEAKRRRTEAYNVFSTLLEGDTE